MVDFGRRGSRSRRGRGGEIYFSRGADAESGQFASDEPQKVFFDGNLLGRQGAVDFLDFDALLSVDGQEPGRVHGKIEDVFLHQSGVIHCQSDHVELGLVDDGIGQLDTNQVDAFCDKSDVEQQTVKHFNPDPLNEWLNRLHVGLDIIRFDRELVQCFRLLPRIGHPRAMVPVFIARFQQKLVRDSDRTYGHGCRTDQFRLADVRRSGYKVLYERASTDRRRSHENIDMILTCFADSETHFDLMCLFR